MLRLAIRPRMEYRVFLVVLAAVVAVGYAQRQCPDVICPQNPCVDVAAACPRFPNSRCTFDPCECRAEFFDRERNVSDRCAPDTCDNRQCSERRVCVEEVNPCPQDRNCPPLARRMRSKCELPMEPRPPTTCDDIECARGQKCVIVDRRSGTVATCQVRAPTTCEEMECDDGMRCDERERDDGRTVVRCVAANPQQIPRDCSEVECRDGMVCMVQNRRAMCVMPPPPETCDELECLLGQVCRVVEPEGRSPRAVCKAAPQQTTDEEVPELAESCDEIRCQEGYECKLFGDRTRLGNRFIARCIPEQCPIRRRPQSCLEVRCDRRERCIMVGERDRRRPRCVDRDRDGTLIPFSNQFFI